MSQGKVLRSAAVGSIFVFAVAAVYGEERVAGAEANKRAVAQELRPVERQGFLKALGEQDERYDPKERMLQRPFSSPGYHTALTGGFVHPTRDSLSYAVALLDTGEEDCLTRAQAILRRVISLQDQDPKSRTYGIWSWFLEEPLDKMSPPDWNWADFCGGQLLQVAIDHSHRLPRELAEEVKKSILYAAESIKRRNVGPGYTNIALMGTYVTLVAGEHFDEPGLLEYGVQRLKRFCDYTTKHGSFSEYNSPTYTIVAIEEISRMLLHVRDAASRELLRELNHLAWYHVARRFHPPTRQWAGPHSRSYSTFLRPSALAFIQRAMEGGVCLMAREEAALSLNAHRLRCRCPDDLVYYFTRLGEPRFDREVFIRNKRPQPDTIGSTYLHPAFTLGSVNCGNLWNQRRPLIAYWGKAEKVSAFRIRFLHDGYDFSSAMFFSVQDEGDVLAAVNLATDGGDTHPSLDRVRNATIRAQDLRLRFLIENVGASPTPFPSHQLGGVCVLDMGSIALNLCVPYASFGDFVIRTETGGDEEATWLDIVLYHGEEREISFRELKEAVFLIGLRMRPFPREGRREDISPRALTPERDGDNLRMTWKRRKGPTLCLRIAAAPETENALRSSVSARIGDADAWE